MMELDWSPHQASRNSALLLSPNSLSISPFERFPSIKQIRRSLSRSPSKAQKYSLSTHRSERLHSNLGIVSPPLQRAHSAVTVDEITPRQKYPVKRPSQPRTPTRRQSPPTPLRRALSDNTPYASIKQKPAELPAVCSPLHQDQENVEAQTVEQSAQAHTQSEKLNLDNSRMDKILQPIMNEYTTPMKSSPLKRSDGAMNLEAASLGSPRHKRRSLHSSFMSHEFNIFDQTSEDSCKPTIDSPNKRDLEMRSINSSTWPNYTINSPQRRSLGLRKSTLQQRGSSARMKPGYETTRDAHAQAGLTRTKSRSSLNGSLPLRGLTIDAANRRSDIFDGPSLPQPLGTRQYQSAPKPHPLSQALTPSSSSSSFTNDTQASAVPETVTAAMDASAIVPSFARSLPIAAMRSSNAAGAGHADLNDGVFATPDGYKTARPLPQAFMSTGLISKRNRNVDMDVANGFGNSIMPDTPSKKATHVQILSPNQHSPTLDNVLQPMHEFGSPSTPFNARISKVNHETFGKGAGIFGASVGMLQLTRRGSFLSVDGDDLGNSPIRHLDRQMSTEELPPTPTKSTGNNAPRPQSRGKSNSLRSSLFGRRRSLGTEMFTSAAGAEATSDRPNSGFEARIQDSAIKRRSSPHPSQEISRSFTPPDASYLSLSAEGDPSPSLRRTQLAFAPATPTGPKESVCATSLIAQNSSSFFSHDVDTSLTTRFDRVTTHGIGEFSHVYRVESLDGHAQEELSSTARVPVRIWAVKKSRRPYTGNKDRQRKLQEVNTLKSLRGQEHIVELVDHWESKNHLYIQTEFCENGNLKDFLSSTGFKGRLDDFRIWKILLELSHGLKSIHDADFMHLDLKPANVFIDWEGVLKIGDFGMASVWPAPTGIEGEGDREYIGPEVLSGRFDKPADVFALGMIMLEIAGNIVLPDNGSSWQRLRAGDMSDLPSLTWSSDASLARDESGDPIDPVNADNDRVMSDMMDEDDLSFLKPQPRNHEHKTQGLVSPPDFMVDPAHIEALDKIVQWMICPNPVDRPLVHQLLLAEGIVWVSGRRRAGATIYEGNWGPADDVLHPSQDIHMIDT